MLYWYIYFELLEIYKNLSYNIAALAYCNKINQIKHCILIVTVNSTDSFSGEAETQFPQSPSTVQQQATITCDNITCQEGFYCVNETNKCNPDCHTWNQHSREANIAIDTLVLFSATIGIIAAVGVVVVAGLRWKKVYVV